MSLPFPRFSLALLLVATALVGVALAQSGSKSTPEADATAEVTRQAGEGAGESRAGEVFRAAGERVQAAPAFEVEATMTVSLAGRAGGDQTMRYRVAVERPGRVLVEPMGRGPGVFVADGERAKVFHSQTIGYRAVDQPEELDALLDLDLSGHPEHPFRVLDAVGNVSQGVGTFPLMLAHSEGRDRLDEMAQSLTHVDTVEREGRKYEQIRVVSAQGPTFDMFFTTGEQPMLDRVAAEMDNVSMTIDYDWTFKDQIDADDRFALRAPDFTLKDMDGNEVKLSDHRGNDVVVLDFWATWCAPCVAAMPIIDRVVTDMRDNDKDVVLYAVNQAEGPGKIQSFLDRQELDLNVLRDEESEVAQQYWVTGIPQTVIINKAGEIEMIHVGFGPNLEQTLTEELTKVAADEPIISDLHAGHDHE